MTESKLPSDWAIQITPSAVDHPLWDEMSKSIDIDYFLRWCFGIYIGQKDGVTFSTETLYTMGRCSQVIDMDEWAEMTGNLLNKEPVIDSYREIVMSEKKWDESLVNAMISLFGKERTYDWLTLSGFAAKMRAGKNETNLNGPDLIDARWYFEKAKQIKKP